MREHSRKPAEVYARIEQLVDGPYLELFARPPHPPGWDVWGRETALSRIGATSISSKAASIDNGIDVWDCDPIIGAAVDQMERHRQAERPRPWS